MACLRPGVPLGQPEHGRHVRLRAGRPVTAAAVGGHAKPDHPGILRARRPTRHSPEAVPVDTSRPVARMRCAIRLAGPVVPVFGTAPAAAAMEDGAIRHPGLVLITTCLPGLWRSIPGPV